MLHTAHCGSIIQRSLIRLFPSQALSGIHVGTNLYCSQIAEMGFFLELAEDSIADYESVELVGVGQSGCAVTDHVLMYQLPGVSHRLVRTASSSKLASVPAVLLVVHPVHPSSQELRLLKSVTERARADGSLIFAIAVQITPLASLSPSRKNSPLVQIRPNAWLSLPSHETLSLLVSTSGSAAQASRLMLQSTSQLVANLFRTIRSHGLVSVGADEVRAMFELPARAHLSIAEASGQCRATIAASKAIAGVSAHKLSSVLLCLRASLNLKLREVDEVASLVRESVRDSVDIYWSTVLDESLDDKVHVTLLGAERPEESHRVRHGRIVTANHKSLRAASSCFSARRPEYKVAYRHRKYA